MKRTFVEFKKGHLQRGDVCQANSTRIRYIFRYACTYSKKNPKRQRTVGWLFKHTDKHEGSHVPVLLAVAEHPVT